MEREEYKVTCRKIRIEVPLSKARVIWLQYLYFLLILMTNLDFFFLYLVQSSLVHLLLSHSRIRKLWMVTKGRNFFFFLKGAFTSLSCMGCFIQTHHSSQLNLLNEQEERMRELMYKNFFFWVLLKGHSSFTSRITDTIIMSSNIFGLKNHCHYPFSTIQFL